MGRWVTTSVVVLAWLLLPGTAQAQEPERATVVEVGDDVGVQGHPLFDSPFDLSAARLHRRRVPRVGHRHGRRRVDRETSPRG